MKTKIKDLLHAALAELEQEQKPPWTLTRHLPGFRPLRDGEEWHRQDFTEAMLAGGWRPLLHGETTVKYVDEFRSKDDLHWKTILGLAGEQVGVTWNRKTLHALVRTRRPLPEPAKVVPWDGPEDVPLNCWFRHKNSGDIYWASSIDCAGVSLSYSQAYQWGWVLLAEAYEYSTDRINWKPCTKEVAP